MQIKTNRVFRFFSSVKLAITLILTLMLSIAIGTVLESRYNADFAKVYVYESSLFYLLFFLLFINILFAALSRIPYQRHHTGFVITHLGLLTLILGAFVTAKFGIDGTLRLTEGQSENKIILKDLVLKLGERSIDLNSGLFNSVQQKFTSDFQILKFIPFAEMKTSFVETENSEDALSVGFILKSPLFQNGDMLHLKDKPEIDFGPMRIRLSESSQKIVAAESVIIFQDEKSEKVLQKWNFRKNPVLMFRDFEIHLVHEFKNAVVGEKGLVEGSNPNPAVQIAIHSKKTGKSFKEVLFAFHPEFALNQKSYTGFQLKLIDSSLDQNALPNGKLLQLQVLNSQLARLQVFENKKQILTTDLAPGQKAQLPWMGIDFILGNILNHAKMNLEIREAQIRPGQSAMPSGAVLIRWNDTEYWVSEEYQPRPDLSVARKIETLPIPIKLQQFQKINYPGTEQAQEFKSLVLVEGQELKTISMNEPLQLHGYTLYQSSFDLSDPNHPVSILSVNKDLGRPIKYAGAIILIIGIITYTLMKSRLNKKRQKDQ